MKVSDFVYLGEFGDGNDNRVHAATVVVEHGRWPFKKKTKVGIFRPVYSGYWRFEETGEMLHWYELENLELAYRARQLILRARNEPEAKP